MSTHYTALIKIYKEFGVTGGIIRGRSRRAYLVDIRKVAAFVLTDSFGMHPEGVASLLSRDRTLVYYYVRNFEENLKIDKRLSIKYKRALRALENEHHGKINSSLHRGADNKLRPARLQPRSL